MLKSPYGKKTMTDLRITTFICVCIFSYILLYFGGFLKNIYTYILVFVIALVVNHLLCTRILEGTLKKQIKLLKGNGKMGYSPSSVIEFYEDNFIEITSENKTESKYSAIERVSIVDNKIMYIHLNNVMAFLLPMACFESAEQYESFKEFIKTKCAKIDVY